MPPCRFSFSRATNQLTRIFIRRNPPLVSDRADVGDIPVVRGCEAFENDGNESMISSKRKAHDVHAYFNQTDGPGLRVNGRRASYDGHHGEFRGRFWPRAEQLRSSRQPLRLWQGLRPIRMAREWLLLPWRRHVPSVSWTGVVWRGLVPALSVLLRLWIPVSPSIFLHLSVLLVLPRQSLLGLWLLIEWSLRQAASERGSRGERSRPRFAKLIFI
jgi:hypothetical protein